jgi:two-component system, chemotaxis family, sensor kinase CheA
MSDPFQLSPEYQRFAQTFFEECAEILADMDTKLAQINVACHNEKELDQEDLNAVFRCVHSIKAGAGAFNYTQLVAFSHGFEALLDRMRDGRIAVDAALAALIIRAGDVLAELVAAAQSGKALSHDFGVDVSHNLKARLGETSSLTAAPIAPLQIVNPEDITKTYTICFTPKPDLLRHANEPLLLIRELKTLGELVTVCDISRLPDLKHIDLEDCYLSWRFTLTTARALAEIEEVFEFVTDDAELKITVFDDDGFGLFETYAPASEEDGFGLFEPSLGLDLGPNLAMGTHPTSGALVRSEASARAAKTEANAHASIRVELGRVDRLVNMVGEMVIAQAMLRQEMAQLGQTMGPGSGPSSGPRSGHVTSFDALETLTRDLQACVMAIRMQPVKSVFSRMPRLVREIAGKLEKQVKLTLTGEHTELDKTVIEELSDPLTHMIRNSIDHGIERPDVRLAAGKPVEGTIQLSATHIGSHIVIHIEDDGAGINRERLYQKAIEKNIIAEGTKLSDEETLDLIFAPGFSTALQVTDVSGRGVGMDVVRRNILKIGGRIQVNSTLGQGTRFSLIIPLTLAVLDGMVIAVGAERYILPLTSIIESFRPIQAQIRTLSGGGQVASIRGDHVSLVRLDTLFDVKDAIQDPTKALIVLVETAQSQRFGLVIDELIGQQQVVIKSLQENFVPVAGLSGATILGDGQVALILDIEHLQSLNAQTPSVLAA